MEDKAMANNYAKYEVTYATATNHYNRETFNTMVEARHCWNHHQAMHDQMKASQIRPNMNYGIVVEEYYPDNTQYRIASLLSLHKGQVYLGYHSPLQLEKAL